jgi:hypothetical protein
MYLTLRIGGGSLLKNWKEKGKHEREMSLSLTYQHMSHGNHLASVKEQ